VTEPGSNRVPGEATTEDSVDTHQTADQSDLDSKVNARSAEWVAHASRVRDHNDRAYYRDRSDRWWLAQYRKANVA
jgi:hypothetical protein